MSVKNKIQSSKHFGGFFPLVRMTFFRLLLYRRNYTYSFFLSYLTTRRPVYSAPVSQLFFHTISLPLPTLRNTVINRHKKPHKSGKGHKIKILSSLAHPQEQYGNFGANTAL